jgi:glycerol-3-phosphate dehydrogenase
MPLYGNGLKKPSILRLALLANDFISMRRNIGVEKAQHLPAGKLISASHTKKAVNNLDEEGLKGSALWFDATVPDSHRVLIEVLHAARNLGAMAVNYVQAGNLITSNSSVAGVYGKDQVSGKEYEFFAKVVVNSAGPWCRQLASRYDRDYPKLYTSSVAWNIVVDREPLSDYALAITPKKANAQTYFIHRMHDRMFIGTGHAPYEGIRRFPRPKESEMQGFLDDINLALPGINLQMGDIMRIYGGHLPVCKKGGVQLTDRVVLIDHGKQGGIKGLFSVSGIKFTTSHRVAENTINSICAQYFKKNKTQKNDYLRLSGLQYQLSEMLDSDNQGLFTKLKILSEKEAVVYLDDLIFRRSDLGSNPNIDYESLEKVTEQLKAENLITEDDIVRVRNCYTIMKTFYYEESAISAS